MEIENQDDVKTQKCSNTVEKNMESVEYNEESTSLSYSANKKEVECSTEIIKEDKEDENGTRPSYNILERATLLDLTEEEELLRKKKYHSTPVQMTKIHCTSCNVHLGSAISKLKNIYVHPLLQVIICKKCFEFYQSGEFGKDKDGTDLQCRWCGQGETVICCYACPMVFCELCIQINFNMDTFTNIKNDDEWKCFCCNPSQLSMLKIQCFEFAEYIRNSVSSLASERIDYTRCCIRIPIKRKFKSRDPEYSPKRILNSNSVSTTKKLTPAESRVSLLKPKYEETSSSSQKLALPRTFSTETPKITPVKEFAAAFALKKKYGTPREETKISCKPLKYLMPASSSRISNNNKNIPNIPPLSPIRQTIKRRGEPISLLTTSLRPIQSSSAHYRPIKPKMYTRNVETNYATKENIIPSAKAKLELENRTLQRSICDTALTNSTLATSILKLSQMKVGAQTLNENVTVYNGLAESLQIALGSLLQIKRDLGQERDIDAGSTKRKNRVVQQYQPVSTSTFYAVDDATAVSGSTADSGKHQSLHQ